MGKFIPVEPEKWAEMVKALALVKEMDKTINASQAECRRLKEKSECQAECLEAFDKENARLKDEVERLTADLKRLANAGDIMRDEIANHLVYNKGLKVMNDWQSAKEGNHP